MYRVRFRMVSTGEDQKRKKKGRGMSERKETGRYEHLLYCFCSLENSSRNLAPS